MTSRPDAQSLEFMSVEALARIIHNAEYEDSFDDLNPRGIERAIREQVARAVIGYIADELLGGGLELNIVELPSDGSSPQ